MKEKKILSNVEEARYFANRNRLYSNITLVIASIIAIGLTILARIKGDQANYRLVFCSAIVVNEFATICYLLTTRANLYFYDRILDDSLKHNLIHLEFKVTRSTGRRINLFIELICSIILCLLELIVPLMIADITAIAFPLIYFALMFGNMYFCHHYECIIPTFLCAATFIFIYTGMMIPGIICLEAAVVNLIIELLFRNARNQKLVRIYEIEQMCEDLEDLKSL